MICRLEACHSSALDNFVRTFFLAKQECDLIIAGRASRRDIIHSYGITGRDISRVWSFNESTLRRLSASAENNRRSDPVIVLHEDQLDRQQRAYLDAYARWLDIFCISRSNQLRMGWAIHEEIGVVMLNPSAVAQISIENSTAESVPDPNQGTVTVRNKKPKRKKQRKKRSRFDALEL